MSGQREEMWPEKVDTEEFDAFEINFRGDVRSTNVMSSGENPAY